MLAKKENDSSCVWLHSCKLEVRKRQPKVMNILNYGVEDDRVGLCIGTTIRQISLMEIPYGI